MIPPFRQCLAALQQEIVGLVKFQILLSLPSFGSDEVLRTDNAIFQSKKPMSDQFDYHRRHLIAFPEIDIRYLSSYTQNTDYMKYF